ncbi:MAG: DNA repair protein RecN [Myxococcota bacterium]
MLSLLRIRHFAIIDELEIELGPGLNVLTGETGAGKSIVVAALELVLGAKGRPDVVRAGHKQAEVEALFDLTRAPDGAERLATLGLDPEDELVIRRVVQASGRTRAYVNGSLATAAQLRQIASGLSDICSQHEHHTLGSPRRHMEYLDAFAELGERRNEVSALYHRLLQVDRELTEHQTRVAQRFERADLLRYQIDEIGAAAPEAGEDERLDTERGRLRHAVRLAGVAQAAEEALYSSDDAICSRLDRIGQSLHEAATLDPNLRELAERIGNARAELEDAARDVTGYAQGVVVNPTRLSEVEERLELLRHLGRKYGGSVAAVLERRTQAEEELEDLSRGEEKSAELEADRAAAEEAVEQAARTLSEARQKAAARLASAISTELQTLGMGDARVEVAVAPLDGKSDELSVGGARLSATGIDRVEFLIAPNRGETAKALSKIASGGELSRSLLAIKRVLAGLRPAGLYVFDEVDAGVGGAIAEAIGDKLRDVARHHQVLCITHLPQIAVFADDHYRVEKSVNGGRTRSQIHRLAEKDRREEIARMLGGKTITKRTRAAAREMIDQARS